MNLLKSAASAVGDAVGGMAGAAAGKIFEPLLEKVVDSTLEWLGPKAGDVAAEKMIQKYPKLAKIDTVVDTAKKAAEDAVKGCKDEIMDFCKGASDDPFESFKKDIFENVVEALKAFVKRKLSEVGVPSMISDQLPWDFKENDDVGDPKSTKTPEQQQMGEQCGGSPAPPILE